MGFVGQSLAIDRRFKVTVWFVAVAPLFADHVKRNVKMDVVGIRVNPTMALMFLVSEYPGELGFDLPKNFRGQLGLVFGPERNQQMVSFSLVVRGFRACAS